MSAVIRAIGMCLLCAWSATTAACPKTPSTLEGTLRDVEAEHPNGTAIQALQLVLPAAVEVTGTDEGCVAARVIHLVPEDAGQARRLRARIGQSVRVATPDLFEAHTAWHIGDAVAMHATLLP